MTDRQLAAQADAAFRKTTITYPTWLKNVQAGKYPALGPPSQFGIGFGLLAQIDPVPVQPVFGTGLPARQTQTLGSRLDVTTVGGIPNAVTMGYRHIRLTAPADLGGHDLVLNYKGDFAVPFTIDLSAPVSNGRILISQAAYLNLRFTDLGHSPIDGIKITDGSHHIDVDGRGGKVHHTARQGFLQTDPACHDWQVWNIRFEDCGSAVNSNKDHSVYVHDARGECVVGNLIATRSQNYGFQFYSDCRDLIATGIEAHGTKNNRGGIVIGNEPSQPGTVTSNVRVYGPIVTAMASAVEEFGVATACKVFDGISWWNGADFDPVFSPANCINADPAVKAKGHVDPARYPMLPAFDIDGNARVTADAGARALP